ncbi:MAG: putative selenium-dependent hydroxylase accessory protein YqeC [Spirochaetaceae bacterium]|jgi:probable selenium-dependent hydroxylase accessory protein YqeC|nr:putative selenium-dependent hydroxylase accessory protein YqeC [Spirochaetaceae bacterium]
MRLNDFFGQFNRQIVSVCGCGGKTSLIWALAAQSGSRKTLVTTTTHTQKPDKTSRIFDYFFEEAEVDCINPPCGISFAGNINPYGVSASSFSLPALEKIIPLFDHVFIEADGSRTRPLKSWALYEPVITESTTVTIGILPVWPLGKPVSSDIVHRLPLFTALSGAKEGDTLSYEHYIPIISGYTVDGVDKNAELRAVTHSLFSVAKGQKILFFNQVEDEQGIEDARRVSSMLPPVFRKELSGIIAGSIRQNQITLL